MPTASGAASTGRNTEIVPGNNWPATSARRIPSPYSITSCEVIPPLAITQAGRAASASRTMRDRAADTVRAIVRLPAASGAVTTARLV